MDISFEQFADYWGSPVVWVKDSRGVIAEVPIYPLPMLRSLGLSEREVSFDPAPVIEASSPEWEEYMVKSAFALADSDDHDFERFYRSIALMFVEVREAESDWESLIF